MQEQRILEMIQKGASIADIRSRYGPEAADGAQGILDKARAELEAKIRPLVEAGMTMEDIVEKFGSSAAISSTVSPALTVETTPIPRTRPSLEAPSPIIPDPTPAPEGGRKRKTHYAVVRSVKLRKAAIQIHGNNCCVCKFNFDEAFGEDLAQGYIEVHHLNGIASGVRNTDPATDLAPLCANCHAMADRLTRHHAAPPRSIDELRKLLSR